MPELTASPSPRHGAEAWRGERPNGSGAAVVLCFVRSPGDAPARPQPMQHRPQAVPLSHGHHGTHEEAARPPDAAAALPAADDRARAERDSALAALLAQVASGSAAAFEAFYDQTLGYAQALARRMLRPSDLEDVLASAYFQAWREVGRFDPARGSAVTWLLTLVRSRALDHLRHARTCAALGVDDDAAQAAAAAASDEPGPPDLLAAAEAGTRLQSALARLAAQERWVLGLAYFRDLTHSQIAQQTGLPLGTVKSLILRAQAKLRDMLLAA